MKHLYWIIKDSRIKRDRYGRKYRPHTRCCQRDELCLVGQDLTLRGVTARLAPMPARVLLALMLRRPGVPLSEVALLEHLYDTPDHEADGNPVGVYLSKARQALRAVGGPEIRNHRLHGWELS